MLHKRFTFVLVLSAVMTIALANNVAKTRTSRRLHLPFIGLGPYCKGCPPHFCDDDPAIIHGYCCGCASYFDVLPVRCPSYLNCPLNGNELCADYEYMMHCCCEN